MASTSGNKRTPTPAKLTSQQSTTSPNANNGNLKQFLKDFVQHKVTLSEEDRLKKVKIFKETVEEHVIKHMKAADKLFEALFQNVYYAGSYFDGLKVGSANEFDLNLRLKLPFQTGDVQIVHSDVPPGFAKYKLRQNLETLLARHPKWDIYKSLDKIMDDSHIFLCQEKLNRWHNSVLDKAFPKIKETCPFPLTRSRSGPAMTLKITVEDIIIDVDLVPVVELADFPGSVRRAPVFRDLPAHKRTCFIVPKPCPNHLATLPGHEMFFRVSIPDAERCLLERKQSLKMLIKIFKAIRDHEHWSFLVSYYIKTVFMWQVERNSEDFWKEDRLDELFKQMVQEFISAMDKRLLCHIFFQKYNLISQVDQSTLANCKGRLETILKIAQNDPSKLYKMYDVPHKVK